MSSARTPSSRFRPGILRIAAALGAVLVANVATGTEDACVPQFEAVKSLVDHDCRQPAERSFADFSAAHHPGAQWYEKGLAYYIADRFRASAPRDAAAEYERRYRALKDELDAADRAGALPAAVHALLPGSDATAGFANTLLRTLNPYSPVPLAPLTSSERAAATGVAAALCERALADLDAACAHARACVVTDAPAVKAEECRRAAAIARGAAVEVLFRAWLALGELAWRGGGYGLDPAPARAFMAEAMKRHGAEIADWDFEFDDYLPLHVQANALFAEAARMRLGPVSRAEAEDALAQVTGMKPGAVGGGDERARDDLARLQLVAWTCLLRGCLDQDPDHDAARAQAHGVEVWRAFAQRERADRALRPDGALAKQVGYAHILGARVLRSAGDAPGAMLALAAVADAKPAHPLAGNARAWLRAWKVTGSEIPGAMDPGDALELSCAFLARASSGDANEASAARSTAIQALAAGIRGLETIAAADQAALAPQLWLAYATAIDRQETRLRAAVAASEGVVACAGLMSRHRDVFRRGDGSWTADGEALRQLGRISVSLTAAAYARERVPAVRRLYDSALSAQQAICPEDAGDEQRRGAVIVHMDAGAWDAAATAAHGLAAGDPAQAAWAADVEMEARRRSLDDLRAHADPAALAASAVALETLASARLDAGLATRAPATIEGALSALWSAARARDAGSAAVLGRIDDGLWNALAGEDAVAQHARVRVLTLICEAAADTPTRPREPADGTVDAHWPTLARWCGVFTARSIGLPEQPLRTARTRLAAACKGFLSSDSRAVRDDAQRTFCQLMEPLLSPGSGAPLLAATASMLWSQGERLRAATIYRLLDQALGDDPLVAAYRADPASAVDGVGAVLADRPETRADWTIARDLLVDAPALADAVRQGVAREQWPERPADPAQARARLAALGATAARLRTVLGAERHAAMVAAIAALERLSRMLDLGEESASRQARQLLDAGDVANGIAHADRLYQRQPWVPAHAALYVDGVLRGAKLGEAGDEDLRRARAVAAAIRDELRGGGERDGYWTAYVQVLELSRALRDAAVCERALRFAAVTGSGPWDDLASPPVAGDAAGIRRIDDPTAIDLCARYLALCADVGGAATVELIRVAGGHATQALIVPLGAHPPVARPEPAAPGGVVFVAAEGVTPAPAP